MDYKTATLARKVANRELISNQEMVAFRNAAGRLGWHGSRGRGLTHDVSGERFRSWTALAEYLVAEQDRAELEDIEQAEAEEMAADEARPAAYDAPVFAYLYTTRTPTIHLSDRTAVETTVTEEIIGVTEGPCQSGASLECSPADPNMGLLRTLPESMLPGQERTVILQCLPCYEASCDAYVRKLHHA